MDEKTQLIADALFKRFAHNAYEGDLVLSENDFDNLMEELVKKLNIDDVSKRLKPNYDNPKNGFVKLRADDCGNEIG